MIKKSFFIIFLIWVNSIFAFNGIKSDTLFKPSRIIDSLVFSEKLDWSVRLVSNFKQQRFRIGDEDETMKYIPNNPFGVGFGIANQKLVIDIVFNIKGTEKKEEQTEKFAAEGALIIKKNNYFSFILENVHGHNVSNSYNDLEEFREDISLLSVGLNYLRIFNKNNISIRDLKSGLRSFDKTTFTFGIGGFFIVHTLNSDGSIIPNDLLPLFNEEAQITKVSALGVGMLTGISAYFKLPANFFAAFYIAPGVGLEYKKIHTETDKYIPSNPLLYKTDLFGSVGYNKKQFYINFTFATNIYATSFDFDNKGVLSVTKSKLILGYNIGKITLPRKIF